MFPELKQKAAMQETEIQKIVELSLEESPHYNFDEALAKIMDTNATVKKLQASPAEDAIPTAKTLEESLQGLETWMDTVLTPAYDSNMDSIVAFSGDWTLENLDSLSIEMLANKKLGSALKGVRSQGMIHILNFKAVI